MKKYLILLLIVLFVTSSGCIMDGIYRGIYNGFNSVTVTNLNHKKLSYDANKREREKTLKEGRIIKGETDFIYNSDMDFKNSEKSGSDNIIFSNDIGNKTSYTSIEILEADE